MKQSTFNSIVTSFDNARDKSGAPLNMDALIISDKTDVFTHYFNKTHFFNDVRSLSKTILAMAIGKAIADGVTIGGERLSLDTKLWQFFEGKVPLTNPKNRERLQHITIKHALTHTMGFDVGLMFSKDIKDKDPSTLLEYIFNTDLVFEPGQHFVYTNAGPYILSAMIQEELGQELSTWVGKLLFEPLEISKFEWKKYGAYCAGSSGLSLSIEDLHKIGRLFITNGYWNEISIVPESWLKEMCTPVILTPTMFDDKRVFPKYAYGFGLWICQDGRFYVDGTDGQYLIVLPNAQMIITTFGHQSDMKPITECLKPLLTSYPEDGSDLRK